MYPMTMYYHIWIDCIKRLKSQEKNRTDWKLKSMVSMTFAMTFNFVFIMVILQKELVGYFYEINITGLSGFLNYILTIFILYVVPISTINYLLIFRNNRFKKLAEEYPFRNGKLFLKYFLISIFSPIAFIWTGVILGHLQATL